MAKQTIDLGTLGSVSGDTIRNAFDKCNDNFDELYQLVDKLGGYKGEYSTQTTSTTTSFVYSSTFGDTIPPGNYLAIVSCWMYSNTTGTVHTNVVFDGVTNIYGVIPSGSGFIQNVAAIAFISPSSNVAVKVGVRRRGGTGDASANQFKWIAIPIRSFT